MTLPAPIMAPWDRQLAQQDIQEKGVERPVSARFTFSMEGWHVWCGSVTENPDGRFSLFFSCWPESTGHEGWVTHSQIWRAEADRPWGPFSDPKVIFSGQTVRSWDADNFHNVTVKNFDRRYFIYYTGNFGNGEWWVHRNNQRIGVAVAESPEGPWSRHEAPLLDISPESWDSLCLANPSVTQTPTGRIMIIYKGVTLGDPPFGSKVLHGVAFADHPEGPFTKNKKPIFQVEGSKFPFEDPHVWQANGIYRCLMKDMVGLAGSCPRATLLFESENGLDWPTDHFRLIATPHLEMADGRVIRVERLERPAYFLHPASSCLSFAVKPEGGGASFLVFAPGLVEDRWATAG